MTVNRRNFIRTTASATTALLLSSLDTLALSDVPAFHLSLGPGLKILATNWGFKGSLDEYCAKVKQEGYDGIEIWWPMNMDVRGELFTALKKYELEAGFLCGAYKSNWQEHFDDFRKMIFRGCDIYHILANF